MSDAVMWTALGALLFLGGVGTVAWAIGEFRERKVRRIAKRMLEEQR